MSRLLFTFIIMFIFVSVARSQYVTLEGRQFKDENGEDFYPVVCNYIVDVVNTDHLDFSTTHLSPEHSWGTGNDYECTNCTNCDQQLINDLRQIISMGFNTVRIMGMSTLYYSEEDSIPQIGWICPNTGFYCFTNNVALNDSSKNTPFYLEPPYTDGVSRMQDHYGQLKKQIIPKKMYATM